MDITKMTDEEINRYVHEDVMKAHRHNWEKTNVINEHDYYFLCDKCDKGIASSSKRYLPTHEPVLPNYLEHGKAWGELLSWAKEQEWWNDMLYTVVYPDYDHHYNSDEVIDVFKEGIENLFTNPKSLAEHIAEYLEEVKK